MRCAASSSRVSSANLPLSLFFSTVSVFPFSPQKFKEEIAALEKRLSAAREACKSADREVADLKAAAKGRSDETRKAAAAVGKLESRLAELKEQYRGAVESARLASVELPRAGGAAAGAAAGGGSDDEAEAMDVDGGAPGREN